MIRPIEMRKAFARRLANALLDAGIPETEHGSYLKSLTGADVQLPKRWLQGISTPTRTTLSHIAASLKIRRDWLSSGTGQMK